MPERPEGCCAQKVPVPFLPRKRGLLLMKWFGGVLLILVLALILQAGLLAYAMYVLLGLMVVSRFLARARPWLARKLKERSLMFPVSETIAAFNVAPRCALAEVPRITAASAAISNSGRTFLILTCVPPTP